MNQEWFNQINLDLLLQIGIALLIFIVFVLFRKLFFKYLYKLILKFFSKSRADLLPNIFISFEKPLQVFFVILGLYLAFLCLPLESYNKITLKVFRTLLVMLTAWGLCNFSTLHTGLFSNLAQRLTIEIDQILLPFLSKLWRFLIIFLAISLIAAEWNYNIGGFIAGLGLGGLAFALAAQDYLKNFFGGLIIITERPFSIDDWIQTPSVEGVVEDITFRNTKIRTFAQALVTVPNSTLANEPITNWTKMGKRQISFNLQLKHSTPQEKIQTCVKRMESAIKNHPGIDPGTIMVYFNEFGDQGPNIFFYFFTKTTVWAEHLQIKEEINLSILKILEEEEISLALPIGTIHFEKTEGPSD